MKREGTKVAHLLEIVKNMEPVDERLYTRNLNAADVRHYFSEADWLQEEWKEIEAEGERLLQACTPELTYTLFDLYAKTGSRREYEQAYFERRRRLNTFALLTLRSPEKYLDPLLDILWAICDEYSWCVPAHLPDRLADNEIDLFAAETGFALAEIFVLMQSRLPTLIRDRIRSEVERRVLTPFLAHGPYAWETATHNWSAVCAGSVGAAALLLEQDAGRLADILARTERSMEYYLSGFGADGACLEGIGYWRYGFGYFMYYAELLSARSKGRLDWFRREKVAQIAAFQQKCFLCGDQVANFSDSHPRNHVHLGLSHKLAERFPGVTPPPARLRAPYTEDHCSRWAPALRNLLWTRNGIGTDDWESGSSYLPDAKWLVARHRSGGGVFGFAAKGGCNDEPHNHNDLGHFMLVAEETVFLCDLGAGEYRKGYFGDERYVYDCNGSQGHSVPIVNGSCQAPGAERRADVLEAAAGPRRDRLKLDISGAYPDQGLEALDRDLEWEKGELPSLKLVDEFRFTLPPESIAERFVTQIKPQFQDDGSIILIGAGRRSLRIDFDQDLYRVEMTEHSFTNHFGVDEGWYGIDFHVLRPAMNQRLEFAFRFE